MKGLFIPEITAEMFRNGCLESIEALMAEGEVYDIEYDPKSAQPEIKPIEYRDCANAMLRMWMDNVVTDGEYNRIMNKLNAHWGMKNG